MTEKIKSKYVYKLIPNLSSDSYPPAWDVLYTPRYTYAKGSNFNTWYNLESFKSTKENAIKRVNEIIQEDLNKVIKHEQDKKFIEQESITFD